ncbi:MAG: family transcriptional regulator, cyclic receptor protein [Fimbriimonadaceae bacterium]|jgi:CRP-like cAMP-binding protein|nr:family transcriptional regulator, cyclic receptor protein [Fimbriimonadaceae bacterium]
MTMTLPAFEPDLARTLRYNYIFRGLTREVVSGIAALASIRTYKGGDILVRQFERNSDLIIILEGTARIRSLDGDTIAEFGPGSIVGEIALIDDQPRSATVAAMHNVKAAIIPSKALHDYMDMDPSVGKIVMTNIARVLCRRMRSMNAQTSSHAPQHMHRR